MNTSENKPDKSKDILSPDPREQKPYKGPVVRGDEAVENKEEEEYFDQENGGKKGKPQPQQEQQTTGADDKDDNLKDSEYSDRGKGKTGV